MRRTLTASNGAQINVEMAVVSAVRARVEKRASASESISGGGRFNSEARKERRKEVVRCVQVV